MKLSRIIKQRYILTDNIQENTVKNPVMITTISAGVDASHVLCNVSDQQIKVTRSISADLILTSSINVNGNWTKMQSMLKVITALLILPNSWRVMWCVTWQHNLITFRNILHILEILRCDYNENILHDRDLCACWHDCIDDKSMTPTGCHQIGCSLTPTKRDATEHIGPSTESTACFIILSVQRSRDAIYSRSRPGHLSGLWRQSACVSKSHELSHIVSVFWCSYLSFTVCCLSQSSSLSRLR